MDPGTWELTCGLFEQAVHLPARDRPAFLEKACGDDTEVLRLVSRMLEADQVRSNVVDRMSDALDPVRPPRHTAPRRP